MPPAYTCTWPSYMTSVLPHDRFAISSWFGEGFWPELHTASIAIASTSKFPAEAAAIFALGPFKAFRLAGHIARSFVGDVLLVSQICRCSSNIARAV